MEVSRQTKSKSRARAQAIEELLACDFSQLNDIVANRESDLPDKLLFPLQLTWGWHRRFAGSFRPERPRQA
jgi:hypothetical protein